MPTTRPVPWLELILGGGLALWITLVVLIQMGLPPINAVLWLIAIAIAIVGIAIRVIGREKKYGMTILILAIAIALILLFATTDIQEELLPFCGDGACNGDECSSGCSDCSAATCKNGICEPALERCDTSADCACPSTLACAPTRTANNPDLLGCVVPFCGDGSCDMPVETRENCCMDCGCSGGLSCLQNLCYFIPPQVGTSDRIIGGPISALTLAANPTLTDENGIAHPIATLSMSVQKADARNTTVSFTLGTLAHEQMRLGDVRVGTDTAIPWQLKKDSITGHPLSILNDTEVTLTVGLEYYDAQHVRHVRSSKHIIVIQARDTIDAYGHRAFLVTPEDVPYMGATPRDVWDTLATRVDAMPVSTNRIKFPIETLTDEQGTRDDIAVLYASALERSDLNPSIVDSPVGTLIRVRDDTRTVMLDPALIDESFEDAIIMTPGYAVDDVSDTWIARNSTAPLQLTQELITGGLVRSKLDSEITCGALGPRAIAVATIYNDGLVPVSLCITTDIWRSDTLLDEREQCITVDAWARQSVRHGWLGRGFCDRDAYRVNATYRIIE